MVMSDLVERLRRRTLVHHGGESKYGWNLTEGDSELHVEAATEIEALRAMLATAQIHCDMAVSLLAEWCVDVGPERHGLGRLGRELQSRDVPARPAARIA